MKTPLLTRFTSLALGALLAAPLTAAFGAGDDAGFKSLFNGKDLTGWEGVPELWSVQEGAITGKTTKEVPAKENTFLVWKDGTVSDFELHAKFKLVPGDEKDFANSGIQYRSKVVKPEYFVVAGYQADMEAGKTYSGILYEEKGRGILAKRGEKVVIKNVEKDPKDPKSKNFKIEVAGSVGNSDEIQASIKQGDWNDYVVIAKGNHLQHFINGRQTIDITDETKEGAKSGVLALQLHAGPPMMAQFKDIKLKELK
jgi:3-keto-disaccharide hydrolase